MKVIADHFALIQDPRIARTKRHMLIDIITIAVCAVLLEQILQLSR